MKNKVTVKIFLLIVLVFFSVALIFIAFRYFQKKQQFKNYDSQRMSAFDNLVREDEQDKLKKYKDLLGNYPLPGYSSIDYDERMGDVTLTEDGKVANVTLNGISTEKFRKQNLYSLTGAYIGNATIGSFYILNAKHELMLIDVILGLEVNDENGNKVDMLQPLHELVLKYENKAYSEGAFYDLLTNGIVWQLWVFDRTDWPVGIAGYKETFMSVFKPYDLEILHKFANGEIQTLETPPLFLFTMIKWPEEVI